MKKRIFSVVFIFMTVFAVLWGAGEVLVATDAEENVDKNKDLQIAECDGQSAIDASFGTEEKPAAVSASRMLHIDGEIYYDTGRISDAIRCGVMDHVIASTVSGSEIPTEDNQSNFGTDYGYQRWSKGQVHVNIDDVWHIFQASEAYRLTVTNGNNGEIVELERGLEFWEVIEKYQKLDVTKKEKQEDRMGYSVCLRLYDKEDNLIGTVTPYNREINLNGVYYADNGYGTTNELYLALSALFEENLPEATATEKVVQEEGTLESSGVQGADNAQGKSENIDVLEDVFMTVTYATNKGANLVLMNYSDKNMECGDDYELQMQKDGEWYRVDYIIDNWAFNAIAYRMPQNEPISMCVDWTHFHGILPTGRYRIVKSVMDFRGTGDYTTYRLAAEFEVK